MSETDLDAALREIATALDALAHMEPQQGRRKRVADHLRAVRTSLELLRGKRDEMVAAIVEKS